MPDDCTTALGDAPRTFGSQHEAQNPSRPCRYHRVGDRAGVRGRRGDRVQLVRRRGRRGAREMHAALIRD